MKKLIITGATGAIGSAIVKESLKEDYCITCIVRPGSERVKNIPQDKRVKIIECDLEGYNFLKLKDSFDIFIHLAWEKTVGLERDDAEIQAKNIQYTLDAVRLAARLGCSVFIGAGSQAEYGPKTEVLTSSMPVQPESGYGIAKFAAGQLAKMLCQKLGLRFNWLRILSVYGQGDAPGTLISYTIQEIKAGRSPELTKCNQIWDYLNCLDAARAFIFTAEKGINGKIYPVGSGQGRKLSEYIQDIRDVINPSVKLIFGQKPFYPHQPMFLVADISEIEADTGWCPRIGFKEGIIDLLNN